MGFIKSYADEKAKSFSTPCMCRFSHTNIHCCWNILYASLISPFEIWFRIRYYFCVVLVLSQLPLEIKTAIFMLCHVNICNGQNNHSSNFAGDCCFIACSCMLIGRDCNSLFKRLAFLQGSSSSSSLRQVPNLCNFCFLHLGSCCRVISCNVLDFIILGLDDSGSPALQITLPLYKFFLSTSECWWISNMSCFLGNFQDPSSSVASSVCYTHFIPVLDSIPA